jgi:hypothetical protein
MIDSFEKRCLQNKVAEDQHDIESIEIYLSKQDGASITSDQVYCLRGLQEMYRNRIVGLEVTIVQLSDEEAPAKKTPVGLF